MREREGGRERREDKRREKYKYQRNYMNIMSIIIILSNERIVQEIMIYTCTFKVAQITIAIHSLSIRLGRHVIIIIATSHTPSNQPHSPEGSQLGSHERRENHKNKKDKK